MINLDIGLCSVSRDNTVISWDLVTFEKQGTIGILEENLHQYISIPFLCFSRCGSKVAFGSHNAAKIKHAESVTHFSLGETNQFSNVRCGCFNRDGSRIITGHSKGEIVIWNAFSAEIIRSRKLPRQPTMYSIDCSADDSVLIFGDGDRQLHLANMELADISIIPCQHSQIRCIQFNVDNDKFATGGDDGPVYVWDTTNRRLLSTLHHHEESVLGLCFAPDGVRLATCSSDCNAVICDTISGSVLHALQHTGWVFSVSFNYDGSRIASGCADGVVRVWDSDSGEELCQLEGHSETVYVVAFSPTYHGSIHGDEYLLK